MHIYAKNSGEVIGYRKDLRDLQANGVTPGTDVTYDVDFEANPGFFDELEADFKQFTVDAGELNKNGTPVVLNGDGDQTAVERYMAGLSQAQVDGMRAAAKAHMQGLTNGSSDADKAVGYVLYELLRDK